MSEEPVNLGIAGLRVEQCCLYGSSLVIRVPHEREWTQIGIDGRFRIRDSDGESWFLVEEDRGRACSATSLFWKTVEGGQAGQDGSMEIKFTDGTEIYVPPDPDYEAWHLGGPGRFSMVSVSGGGLFVVGPHPS